MNIINRIVEHTRAYRALHDRLSAEALALRDERDRLKKENTALRLNCHALADDRNKWAQKYVETQQQAARQTKTKRTARKDTNKQDK